MKLSTSFKFFKIAGPLVCRMILADSSIGQRYTMRLQLWPGANEDKQRQHRGQVYDKEPTWVESEQGS